MLNNSVSVGNNNDSRAIVSNTIALGKNLDVAVVAEGVETKKQLNFLIANHCAMAQGYYFSVPLEAGAFIKLLKSDIKFIKLLQE